MILALDLEGTLISNAVSQIPRPGLREFLENCRALFGRIVIFTSVREERFRAVAAELVARGEAPDWFAELEFVHWEGAHKRMHFVPGAQADEVVLVDDMEAYVHPDDRERWIAVPPFEPPYGEGDRGLEAVLATLRRLCGLDPDDS
jgi:hypothetical protein